MKSLTHFSDQQLIELYLEGNNEAISILVERHKDKIFTSIYLLVKDKYLAEDIFQDTFIRIIGKLQAGKYTENGKFLPWAMRIAHNICIDHFRKIKRTPSIRNSDNQDIFDTMNFAEAGADERIMQNQSHKKVRKMLEKLPADQRDVLIMRNYADLSFKEIAEMMDCSINTALGRMRYGLMNMKKMMTEEEITCRMI
jgi:RNA polymerase sigma-70 factor (ECF subfamily)